MVVLGGLESLMSEVPLYMAAMLVTIKDSTSVAYPLSGHEVKFDLQEVLGRS